MNLKTQECVTAFKNWLRDDKGDSINTCKTKLAHVKKFLLVAHKENVYVNFFKGQDEKVNPHECYRESDIIELIEQLRDHKCRKVSNIFCQSGPLFTLHIITITTNFNFFYKYLGFSTYNTNLF